MSPNRAAAEPLSRRRVLGQGAVAAAALWLGGCREPVTDFRTRVFIGRATSYDDDLAALLSSALAELGIGRRELARKRVLLKPNLVETRRGAGHINTNPQVVRAAAEACRRLGAASVVVAEGPGHRRDTRLVLEESGLGEVLLADRLRFIDLNREAGMTVANAGRRSGLTRLTLPAALAQVDVIVSVAKLKTHHWAGVTLSMKNLFGLMPGNYYGWPKNVLHYAGLQESILDIVATVKPQLAIVDGIVGMEGDGPILGTPKAAGVLVVGANLPAVDATAARIMGIDPERVPYLAQAAGWLGPIAEAAIAQVGETLASAVTPFELLPAIPAHRILRGGEAVDTDTY